MNLNKIMLFAKYPEPGQVKTRLGKEIGELASARLATHFVEASLTNLEKLKVELELCYAPDASRERFESWLGQRVALAPQGEGDFGERFSRAFSRAFAAGAQKVLALGADTPDLPPSFITQAFSSLSSHSCVLGPACDGGYYLIGMRADSFEPAAFEGIDWGGPSVFRQTLEILRQKGRVTRQLSYWRDIDCEEDLEFYLEKHPELRALLK